MKNYRLIFIFFVLFLSKETVMAQIYNDKPAVNSFKEMETLFKIPPVEYRTAPLWVWNDDISKEKIDEDLNDLKSQGVWGAFIHPRPSLITPYLSKEWFTLVRHAVDKGKELGMHIWLYDEDSYPSGFAGGNVPAQMPESYNQGQGLIMKQTNILPDDADNYFIILKEENGHFVDISGKLQKENGKKGNFYLFNKTYYEKRAWHGGYSYVDLIYKGVTEKFIDITMRDGYQKAIGDEFGKTVPGIFTDEPNINPPGDASVRWTPDLFSVFEKQYGYDLKTVMPSLWLKTGNWRKIRYDYQNLLLELFIDRWSKPWHNYCKQNNLKWTGHYWEHGWPKLDDGPDNMAMYAWHQQPAIDILMNQYREDVNAQFGNVRSVKELRSVANQLGQNRTLSETYGAGGWDLRFQDMKRIGDWEYVLGVNFMDQHLTYMTIKGARKRDHPQSFSYHEPWWRDYHLSADYFARLSLAMSSGDQINSILVLEPTTTSWINYTTMPPDNGVGELGAVFQKFLLNLEKLQTEYDIGSEHIIKNNGKISDGLFTIGKRSYQLLIIPPGMENFSKETVGLLEQYLSEGGKILSFAGTPHYINGNESSKIKDLAKQYSDRFIIADDLFSKNVQTMLANPEIRFHNPQAIKGKLFHHRRKMKDGEVVFLVNSDDRQWSQGSFNVTGKSLSEFDLFSGQTKAYPCKKNGEQLIIDFNIPPAGSLLLYVSNKGNTAPEANKNITVTALKPLGKTIIERMAPNVLTLDYCDYGIGDITVKDVYCIKAANKIFEHYGFDGNPWSRAVQYKDRIISRNHFPAESGFKADYNFEVAEGVDLSTLQVVVEKPLSKQVLINDHNVAPTGNYWLDKEFIVFNIGKYVTPGQNKITLIIKPMSVFAELESIYIRGNFALETQNKGFKIIPAFKPAIGSWKENGLPFYADSVRYKQNYKINASKKKHYIVKLTHWRGTIASVKVNGKNAGFIYTPPYELDISRLIKEGENEIAVTIIGSLKNTLGPHHAGVVKGSAWPNAFMASPGHQPSGSDYDFIDYGLFREFILLESNGKKRVYLQNYETEKPQFHYGKRISVDSPLSVTISCDTKDAIIHYTLDGSSVTETSPVYTKQILLKKSATVKARAFKSGLIESDEVKQSFHIVNSKKNGLNYNYYTGIWTQLPDFKNEKIIKKGKIYDFSLEEIAKNRAFFGLVFYGFLQIDHPAKYTFYVRSNDGSLLFINDKMIVDNDGLHGMGGTQGEIYLDKGMYSIRLEYFDGGGSQGLEVSYQANGVEKQQIPADKLFLHKS